MYFCGGKGKIKLTDDMKNTLIILASAKPLPP